MISYADWQFQQVFIIAAATNLKELNGEGVGGRGAL